MNAPHLPQTLDNTREMIADAAHDAADLAREKFVRPARRILRQSRRQFNDLTDQLTHRFGEAAEGAAAFLHDRRDRAANWMASNPFTAFAAAAGAGALLMLLVRRR